jgi:O-antigen/teichoic acid export membrane protein
MSTFSISANRQVLALSGGEIAARVLGFAGMVFVARSFGADVLGIIALGSTLLTVFSAIAAFGQDTHGVRRIASGSGSEGRILAEVISSKLILSIPVTILFFVIVAVMYRSTGVHHELLYLFAIPLLFSVFGLDFLFIGEERNHLIGARMLLQAVCYVICLAAISLLKGPVLLIPLSLAGATLAGTLFMHMHRRIPLRLSTSGILRRTRQSLEASAILGLSQVSVVLYLQLNIIVVGAIVASTQLGIYAAAQRLTAAMAFVPGVLLQVYMARISAASSAGERQRCIGALLQPMSLIGGLLCGNLFIFAPFLITIVYGEAYSAGTLPLRLLSVSLWCVFYNMSFANPLLLWNEERKYLAIALSAGIVNLAASVVLIYQWGITGAAIAMMLTETYVLAMSIRAYTRVVGRYPLVQWKLLFVPLIFVLAVFSGILAPAGWSTGFAAITFNVVTLLSTFVLKNHAFGMRSPDASD